MKKLKIKLGDNVQIIKGKDKGREAKVEKVNFKKGMVIASGVNLYKRHLKGNQSGLKAGIYDIPRPLHISKVMLVCPNCKKATRVKIIREKNEVNRYCKKCNMKI